MNFDGRKLKSVDEEYIKIPKNVLSNIKLASKSSIIILIYISNCNDDTIDIESIKSSTGYDKETIEEALFYWVNTGVLMLDEDDTKKILARKLELMIEREPLPYEISKIFDTYKSTGIDEFLLYKILDIGKAANKTSPDWVCNVIKECAKSSNPEETCNEFERYFSLVKVLTIGIPIERTLTSKERAIILDWAKKKIPSTIIFNASELSKHHTKQLSFAYMKAIIDKIDLNKIDRADGLGY